jgi:hypothetical protein
VDAICEGQNVDLTQCHKSREKNEATAFIFQASVKIMECTVAWGVEMEQR